ncbi:trypsin-like peptidase domain-containing protein [Nocardioides sp. GCM10027113]|uniref:trypsin-like peptidase domain-containing protein n=1 Tax=unclassified Nocardioides TaxID=2615069 RepID=UPI00360AD24B
MRLPRIVSARLSLAATPLLLAGLLTAAGPAPAVEAASGDRVTRWVAADRAAIRPGVQMVTKGAQCTANFVFSDRAGRVYVGYAAHCAGKGEATDTNGCRVGSLDYGTRVRFVEDASVATRGEALGKGTLVYSAWREMRLGVTPANACEANDFALVRVDRRDVRKVNPTVPFWGGPTGLGGPAASGEQVYTYGHSSLRPGTALSPKTGSSLGRSYGGWGWEVYTATPGIPGDSGSGFLDPQGRAAGTLSTVAIAPRAGSNGLGNLRRELRFARKHSDLPGLRLVRGTEPFSPAA